MSEQLRIILIIIISTSIFGLLLFVFIKNYIRNTIEKIQTNNEDQDFFSAIKICKKKRIGPSRDEANRPLFYKKDIGVLARSGFDFEVSRRVMKLEKDEYLKIINLL